MIRPSLAVSEPVDCLPTLCGRGWGQLWTIKGDVRRTESVG